MALQTAQIRAFVSLTLRYEQNLDDKISYNNLSCNVQLRPLTSVRVAASHVSRISRTYLDLLKPLLESVQSVMQDTSRKHSDFCMRTTKHANIVRKPRVIVHLVILPSYLLRDLPLAITRNV
jgi:hypothetical protein